MFRILFATAALSLSAPALACGADSNCSMVRGPMIGEIISWYPRISTIAIR